MKKTKFQIKGMHCNSCASLIEEKLKDLPGVIKSKINYESGKGIIIYDEDAIGELKIKEEIENVGDYRVEKIDDAEKEKNTDGEEHPFQSEEKNNFSRPNLSIPISIIIAGLIIAGAIIIVGSDRNGKNTSTGQNAQIQDLPSQPNNDTQKPLVAGENAPVIQTFEITKNDHVRGDFSAPITFVEFSDFECPFSARHFLTLNKILSDYRGKVRLVYKHFPLGFHSNAQKAAEASECADEQGKFWEYHDKLFENLNIGYSTEKFKQWAKDLDLNSEKFNKCLDSDKYAQKVQADFQEGGQKEVNGTPATFVNGQLISGALPHESFKQIIDSISQ